MSHLIYDIIHLSFAIIGFKQWYHPFHMNRKKIRDIRHEEFIVATLEATHKRGFHSVTMSEIAAEIGATAASINYYFGSKEQLMFETMRHLLRILNATHTQYLEITLWTPKTACVPFSMPILTPDFSRPNTVVFGCNFGQQLAYILYI